MNARIDQIDQIDQIVADARVAMRQPSWQDRASRARFMRRVADAIAARRDEIIDSAAAETGYASARLEAEFERMNGQLRMFADVTETGQALDVVVSEDPAAGAAPRPDLRRMNVPVGPVAVFAASNFALAFGVVGGDTASAWAAGCAVILKSHPAQPATSALVASIVEEVLRDEPFPAVFAHVDSPDVALAGVLVRSPELAAIAFTGSLRVGRAIFDGAARRPNPIPVFAEMGSSNPMLITSAALDARGAEIAPQLAASVLTVSGQLCTKPGTVFVPEGPAGDAFVAQFTSVFRDEAIGRMLTPTHQSQYAASLEPLDSSPVARRVGVGSRASSDAPEPVAYEIDAEDVPSLPGALDERFGPTALFVRYARLEDAVELILDGGGQLTISVHAEDSDAVDLGPVVQRFMECAGRIVYNGYPTGVAVDVAMVHGGPYPASSAPSYSAIGPHAIQRFQRPVAWQNAPTWALPAELVGRA